MQAFLETHCQERHYSFSVKKCGSTECDICFETRLPAEISSDLHFLPDPVPDDTGNHYLPFKVNNFSMHEYCVVYRI